MPETDEAAVLKRAQELWERDGYTTEVGFASAGPLGAEQAESKPILSEEGRKRYLERARFELRKERYRHA